MEACFSLSEVLLAVNLSLVKSKKIRLPLLK
ncbi:MAG: hypothetical protein RLZZ507_3270 [Cyanobacteriota bacterium]|jgi:hypothetical protein